MKVAFVWDLKLFKMAKYRTASLGMTCNPELNRTVFKIPIKVMWVIGLGWHTFCGNSFQNPEDWKVHCRLMGQQTHRHHIFMTLKTLFFYSKHVIEETNPTHIVLFIQLSTINAILAVYWCLWPQINHVIGLLCYRFHLSRDLILQ